MIYDNMENTIYDIIDNIINEKYIDIKHEILYRTKYDNILVEAGDGIPCRETGKITGDPGAIPG